MKIKVEKEFLSIVDQIIEMNKSIDSWDEIESSDMFQSSNYSGGFDVIEQMFTFSVYKNDKEYWFQLSLDDIFKIKSGDKKEIEIHEADY